MNKQKEFSHMNAIWRVQWESNCERRKKHFADGDIAKAFSDSLRSAVILLGIDGSGLKIELTRIELEGLN